MKKVFILAVLASLLLVSCNKEELKRLNDENAKLKADMEALEKNNQKLRSDLQQVKKLSGTMPELSKRLKGVKARLVTTLGEIELKFYTEKAPLHCFNFISRAESGYYDGTQFHRVMPNFMIQAGDPNSKDDKPEDDGLGGPFIMIPHEFNDTPHVPGVLSMARHPDVSAGAGSQFFIMHGTATHLDGQYTAFGEVTAGMDVVNEIARVRRIGGSDQRLQNHPVKPVRIKRVDVYRHGTGRK